jgi:S-adenosyl-L-methionine hydrolase (adenosine-forming)
VKTRDGQRETGRRDDKSSLRPVSASPLQPSGLITLLTDFSTGDYFVAAVKGVILASNPKARIVDMTHDIAPHDIEAGAFTLLAACSSFPTGTIHVAVVDPGVGSSRRPILIQTSEQFFVGPDNGIFSHVCDQSERVEIFHLTNSKYFRQPVSPTFNGRDIFAPVAAALSAGIKPGELGEKIKDHVKLRPLKAETSQSGEIVGRVIHIDRFGNCVTNITQAELKPELIAAGAKLRVKRKLVKSFRSYFAEDTGSKDKVFAIWGSAGFLELAAAQESAAKVLNVRRGDSVIVSAP